MGWRLQLSPVLFCSFKAFFKENFLTRKVLLRENKWGVWALGLSVGQFGSKTLSKVTGRVLLSVCYGECVLKMLLEETEKLPFGTLSNLCGPWWSTNDFIYFRLQLAQFQVLANWLMGSWKAVASSHRRTEVKTKRNGMRGHQCLLSWFLLWTLFSAHILNMQVSLS